MQRADGQLDILLIDDDEKDFIFIRSLLSEASGSDLKLHWVADYTTGLDAICHDTYDVCLLDYRINAHNGLEFLAKATENECRVPVVFLADKEDREVDLLVMKAGATDYLVKDHLSASLLERSVRYAVHHKQRLIRVHEQLRQEIKERKRIESRSQVGNVFLKLLTQASSKKEYLDKVIEQIGIRCGCRHIGIRILDEEGYVPYASYTGFSQEFWESENRLLASENTCVCTRVITGDLEAQDLPCITPGGSFYVNHSLTFAATLTEQEKTRLRGVCIGSGFLSIAVIPIRYDGKVIGAIHLADEREGKVPLSLVECIESFTPLMGEAISKLNVRDALRESREKYLRLVEVNRERAESSLLETEEKLRLVAENIEDAFWLADLEFNKIIYVSPAYEKIWGRSRQSLYEAADSFLETVHPEDKDLVVAAMHKQAQGEPDEVQYRIIKPDDSIRWIYCRRFPIRDDQGKAYLSAGVACDVTERKRSEERLRESEKRLCQAQRLAHLGHWDWYAETNELRWSEEAFRIFGQDPETFTVTVENFESTIHSDDLEEFVSKRLQIFTKDKDFNIEHRVVWPDGSIHHVHLLAEIIRDRNGRVSQLVGTVQDITHRKQVEEVLRKNQKMLAEAERVAHMGAWEWDIAGNRFGFSENWLHIHGVEDCHSSFDQLLLLAHPEDRDAVRRAFEEALKGNRPYDIEHRIIRPDNGRIRFIHVRGTILCDEAGRSLKMYGIAQDVTERKEAEKALRESERQFRMLVETMNEGVAMRDVDLRLTYVNEKFCEMLGYSREELLGLSINEVFDPASLPIFEKETERRKKGHKGLYQADMLAKGGRKVPLLISASPLMDEEGHFSGSFGAFTDITTIKQAEEELRVYMDKLEQSNQALQEFASIASHDLQEPLRKIQSFGNRLISKYGNSLDEMGQDYLSRMQNAAGRMQTLIESLLTYSRVTTKAQPFIRVNLAGIVQEVVNDLEVRIEETGGCVEVSSLPCLEADPHQMRQLFQNLISNALKFQRGGEPMVRVYAQRMDRPLLDNGWYQIFVEDNGIGFDEKHIDRIFAPFQRLHGRSEYEGTGLGLATCKKIVERHRGTLTAKSVQGEGATFIVTLPARQS